MIEKPALPDEIILKSLRAHYDLPISGLDFLPLGNDSSSWAYKVRVEGGNDCFLKVRVGPLYEPSVTIPRALFDQGIRQVVAALPDRSQHLWQTEGRFTLILYPFIQGSTGMETGLTDRQWQEFGSTLKRIHSARLPANLEHQLNKETFHPKWSRVVRKLQKSIPEADFHAPVEQEFALFWMRKAVEIQDILDQAVRLGRLLRKKAPELILCHSDIHTANVLVGTLGDLHIVDWDDPLLAPKERDLMFMPGSPAESGHLEEQKASWFFKGYGNTSIDPLGLAYYRYEWVVQEIGDYGKRVFLTPGLGDATRADALRGFLQLFDPGDVIETAYRTGY